MPAPTSVQVRGPLLPYVEGFWSRLLEQGYSPLTGVNLLRLAAHISRWLEGGGFGVSDLTSERVSEFAAHRRQQGYTGLRTPRAVERLLHYLREIGVAPPPSVPAIDDTPTGALLRRYQRYLEQERSVNSTTISRYLHFATRFLTERIHTTPLELSADDVTSFVLRECQLSAGNYTREPATALRSLLRFLESRGEIGPHLSGCVPAVAQWRLTSLPKDLEPAQVQAVLSACDPDSAIGRRDGAIVHLLVRLGLRAGEVASLLLSDINWRAGDLLVRGKGRCESRLPLPLDVGEALAGYLRHARPPSSSRHAFLACRAPFRPLTSGGVVHAATRALRSAGVAAGGAHLLRHTAATQMLRGGANLAEIGHVLRHRNIDTTAIYAKVDDASLRALVRPWPGGAQ